MNPSKAFAALSNATNLEILDLLKEPDKHFPMLKTADIYNFGVGINCIQNKINLSQFTVSQYLWILCQAGLVTVNYVGQLAYYKRNEKNIIALAEFILETCTEEIIPKKQETAFIK